MKPFIYSLLFFTFVLLCGKFVYAQIPESADVPTAEKKILFVSDNQEHMLTGGRLNVMSPMAEKWITSVAVRSPLTNVGGRLLFGEAIRFGRREGAEMVLHLGDAADISCPDELTAVFDTLDKEMPNMWFMTPGNHDGFLAGNLSKYQPSYGYDINKHQSIYEKPPVKGTTGGKKSWLSGCLSPSNFLKEPRQADILTRGDAIQLYVNRIKSRPGFTVGKTKEVTVLMKGGKSGVNVICRLEEIESKNLAYKAVARICPRTQVPGKTTWTGPYASFIIQQITVGATRFLLLDTSHYANPSLKNVALRGELSDEQKNLIDDTFCLTDRETIVFAGHHPLKNLRPEDRDWVIRKSSRYISGHIHRTAQIMDHQNGDLQTKELNVGSTLDYPPQAVIAKLNSGRPISFKVAGADISDTNWAGFLADCEAKKQEWKLANTNLYKKYTKKAYTKYLLDSLRAASALHDEKVSSPTLKLTIPAGDTTEDWLILDDILKSIRSAEGESRIFWACQAYYASDETQMEQGKFEKAAKKLKLTVPEGIDRLGDWFDF